MITMDLHQLFELFGQQVPERLSQPTFCGVTIDSRKDCSGQLFIAIRGDRFDGHDYVASAYQQGAVVALVERQHDCDIAQIIVADCKQAMAQLANYWRHSCKATVIALTGSNGKTTVKEMLHQILEKEAFTVATRGNFNNDIGVPLTLFEFSREDRYAIVELGANHPGEIANLAQIAEPDVVYVNNVAAAHLTGFGSVQGVIEAKGELYAYCRPEHAAVFNADEVASEYWRSICVAGRRFNCGMDKEADVRGSFRATDQGLSLQITLDAEQREMSLPVFGEHNARNALAAVTLAIAVGIDLERALQNLAEFSGVKGRLQMMQGPAHSRLINDSYNANPDSLEAGIKVLCALKGTAWLALGDMGELGGDAENLHREAARTAKRYGVEKLFGIGPMSCIASREFEAQGYCFEHIEEMSASILGQIHEQVNLLVKGSRSAGMDRLVEALQNQTIHNGGNYAS